MALRARYVRVNAEDGLCVCVDLGGGVQECAVTTSWVQIEFSFSQTLSEVLAFEITCEYAVRPFNVLLRVAEALRDLCLYLVLMESFHDLLEAAVVGIVGLDDACVVRAALL